MVWSIVASGLSSPKHEFLKFLNDIITTVTLSRVRLSKEFFKMYSTAMPVYLWILLATFIVLLSVTEFHTHSVMSSFDILSKIPSHPRTMKSCKDVLSLKEVISGVATTQFGLPPN